MPKAENKWKNEAGVGPSWKNYSPDVGRVELPLLGDAESVGVDALGDVNALRQLVDVLQGPLDAVEDRTHDAGAELDRQGLTGPQDRVADGDAGSVLVDLEGEGATKMSSSLKVQDN